MPRSRGVEGGSRPGTRPGTRSDTRQGPRTPSTRAGSRAASPTFVPSTALDWLRRRVRRAGWTLQLRAMPSQTFRLAVASLLTLLWVVGAMAAPGLAPTASLCVVVVLGGYFLRLRHLAMLLFLVAAAVVYVTPRRGSVDGVNPTVLLVVAATAGIVVMLALSRERLGVQGTTGESMLVDLRDRLRAQSRVDDLPWPWHLEHAIRSAYGDGFAGDFVLARRRPGQPLAGGVPSSTGTLLEARWAADEGSALPLPAGGVTGDGPGSPGDGPGDGPGERLEVLLVDVSGKGTAAGTRALLLSGAFGGLVGALPPERMLAAANDYLLGQRWDEGFATAVHVTLDLGTGAYQVSSAGHPPLLRYDAGSDRWQVHDGEGGPALGLLPGADFPTSHGELGPGDALLLYTDGVVESPGTDLSVGTDLLADAASGLTDGPGLVSSSLQLVDAVAAEDDDRSVVVLWRRPPRTWTT